MGSYQPQQQTTFLSQKLKKNFLVVCFLNLAGYDNCWNCQILICPFFSYLPQQQTTFLSQKFKKKLFGCLFLKSGWLRQLLELPNPDLPLLLLSTATTDNLPFRKFKKNFLVVCFLNLAGYD